MKINKTPIQWIPWHPHQKLWNWTLLLIINKVVFIKPLSKKIIDSIIKIDTNLLKKKLENNPENVNKSGYTPEKPINYFDLGTHEEANELNWVAREILPEFPNPKNLFAFEANPESFDIAKQNTDDLSNLTFLNLALVKDIPENGMVRLFKLGDGLGDSIYRTDKSTYVDVPAKKLSDIIKENNIDLENSINVIRMNIEGCEYDVIEDLLENDLIKYFDGFYGMWDDVGKIDPDRDLEFRKLLKKVNVHPYPFNGRDMAIEARKQLIKKSLYLSIKGLN